MSEENWEVVPKKEVKKKQVKTKEVKVKITEKKIFKNKRYVRAKYNNDSWQFNLLNGSYYDKNKKPYYNKFKIKDICKKYKQLTRRPNNEIMNSMFDKIDAAVSVKEWEKDFYMGYVFNENGIALCDLNEKDKKKKKNIEKIIRKKKK